SQLAKQGGQEHGTLRLGWFGTRGRGVVRVAAICYCKVVSRGGSDGKSAVPGGEGNEDDSCLRSESSPVRRRRATAAARNRCRGRGSGWCCSWGRSASSWFRNSPTATSPTTACS